MAKVLFINPIVRQEDVPRHIPYGIALLASIAMRAGHLVQVYDANAWRAGDEVLRHVIEADDWDVIAIGGITTTYGHVKNICKIARQCIDQSLIVVGGGLLTAMPRDIMSLIPEIDIGVIGEAFFTFNEILDQIDVGPLRLAQIDGIIFRDGAALRMTAARTLLQNLDTLPPPAYELFPLEEVYFPNSQMLFSEEGMTTKRRVDINASYGCSLVCKFCFHLGLSGDMKYVSDESGAVDVQFDTPGSYRRSIRYHSPQYIVSLVKSLRTKYDIDYVAFLDENMMTMDQYSGHKWLSEICDLWIAEGLQPSCVRGGVPHDENCRGVHWDGTSHATLCNRAILGRMHEAGCAALLYGYESFSPQVLKRLGKGASRETNIRSFFWTLESGIRPIPNQIIGFPSEDFESLRADMRAWEELGIVVKPFFATPYPGSMWYEIYKPRILAQYGGDLEKFLLDLGDATKLTAIISENFNAVELYGLRELMINFDYDRIADYEREWRLHHPDSDAMKAADAREQSVRTSLARLQPVG
jgi:anaerobic magnesium-protoporphyrin IX monomethyl ester cyclase